MADESGITTLLVSDTLCRVAVVEGGKPVGAVDFNVDQLSAFIHALRKQRQALYDMRDAKVATARLGKH